MAALVHPSNIARMSGLQAEFHQYGAAGNPAALTHGDFHAGKGVACFMLRTPAGLLNMFNTHTCANYAHTFTGSACSPEQACQSQGSALCVTVFISSCKDRTNGSCNECSNSRVNVATQT